jgi:hypothetical protein
VTTIGSALVWVIRYQHFIFFQTTLSNGKIWTGQKEPEQAEMNLGAVDFFLPSLCLLSVIQVRKSLMSPEPNRKRGCASGS